MGIKTKNLSISISAFVFAIQILQSLFFLNPKFQASSYYISCSCTARFVSNIVGDPEDRFSHDVTHYYNYNVCQMMSNCNSVPLYTPVAIFAFGHYVTGTSGIFIGCLGNSSYGFQVK